MSQGLKNSLLSQGRDGEVNECYQLKATYPQIFSWYKGLQFSDLSETGYRNYAIRFKVSLEELKHIISVFRKGRAV